MLRRLLFAVLLLCSSCELCARGFLDLLIGKRDLEVITVTDTTESGRAWPAPTPQQPQYYIPVSLGYRDLGGITARVKQPPEADALQTIQHQLAKRGYLPASDTTPAPTLVLVMAWGTLNANTRRSATLGAPSSQFNRDQIERFLGGEKLGLSSRRAGGEIIPVSLIRRGLDDEARTLQAYAEDNYYVAVVTAYDLAAMRLNPTVTLDHLWITRIACPSLGLSLPEVLPDMLALAGPNLGRETARPVRTVFAGSPQSQVKLGELQVIEYLKEDPAKPAPAKR